MRDPLQCLNSHVSTKRMHDAVPPTSLVVASFTFTESSHVEKPVSC
jgi:hypothetical protein